MTEIAIIGMSCRYPDARSPQELWENALAQRQAFRRFPPERLRIEDYFCQDTTLPDTTYMSQGAFIENYEFNRMQFRISGSSYRASDLAHWLALDIASQALADAGFSTQSEIPSSATSVIVGNTLTGEFSRANGLRLRWPYVRRVVEAALRQEGWSTEQCKAFLERLEITYKAPFAPVGEETLAGGLSNTIAGRICNYFNLKGGGYTVDGACASSLLAIATACSALASGEVDLALAGGVDLSLDPFELVGFAKTSALASEEMRVYDLRSNGFIPGEGCGFVVLMRYEDALAQQRRIYALVRGWGISSDGSGGITRPEVEGQLLALTHAYQRADVGIDSVAYFEGHGTGTSVGDATELQTIARARRNAQTSTSAAIGSIKANIGHTKAAAGVAGFIKATKALSTQVIPPTTGTTRPHSELTAEHGTLMVRDTGTLWPPTLPLLAGVSAMGFGGINVHLVLEGVSSRRRTTLTRQERCLLASAQDAELILLSGQDRADMQRQVAHLLTIAPRLSRAEVTDLTVHLMQTLAVGPVRAAIVAASPVELTQRLEHLQALLTDGPSISLDSDGGVFLSERNAAARIGFLFPGQSSPGHRQGGILRRRFGFVDDLYAEANLPLTGDEKDTTVAQPAIVTASLAALRTLQRLGITADIGIGHSLGELTALHWAGAFDEQMLLQLAKIRGRAMGTLGSPTGTMISIFASQDEVKELLQEEEAVIAGMNAPHQTTVSGDITAINAIAARARSKKLHVVPLKVSHAFHSPLVAAAARPFAEHLTNVEFQPLQRTVTSTVTGLPLEPQSDLKNLLCEQITAPVQFLAAINHAAPQLDLFIEVGPGRALSGLTAECVHVPAIAMDAGGPSMKGLLHAVGAVFALGVPLNLDLLHKNRFHRPFDLNWQSRFFSNPCEQAPLPGTEIDFSEKEVPALSESISTPEDTTRRSQTQSSSIIELIRQSVAARAELPAQVVADNHRMLSDLHLNSITVGQIVSEITRTLGLLPPTAPTEYADATVAEIAQTLEELQHTGGTLDKERLETLSGVDTWIRAFQVVHVEQPLSLSSRRVSEQPECRWTVLTPPDYPFGDDLKAACAHLEGSGVIVCLPPALDERHIPLLLQGAHEVLRKDCASTFVLVQHGGGGAGVARTLYLEAPKHTICVVDVPPAHPQTVDWVLAEIQAAHGYSEALYEVDGTRRIPTLRLLSDTNETSAPLPLSTDDVLLVTGGGKGIAAECALSLACETSARLVLIGRSQPSDDSELAANLKRFAAAEIDFRYLSVDVTRFEEVQRAIGEIEKSMGPITAILHGAGTNIPKLLGALDGAAVLTTLAPKVLGLRHILSSITPEKLRLLVTFGSVIARTGLRGEADYALANDWLGDLTERFQAQYSSCRCLCLEWSVWAGVGMGERIGTIESLMQEGIMPISTDRGVACFMRLLKQRLPSVRMVITSRFGATPTLHMFTPDLPLLRFLEQTRIYYPGIELINDVEISTAKDLYLEGHKLRGERLLPAVVGLEAMAQAAMAVTGQTHCPTFEQVQLERPIVVPERASLKIRLAALVSESGAVDVVLRSEETAFQVDHFRATCRFAPRPLAALERLSVLPRPAVEMNQKIRLEPARDLYGSILFHQEHFQRLHSYTHLRATECVAEIMPYTGGNLFAHYLPADLMLGDFVARDAVIHAIQACIPHARLLPIAVEEIIFAPDGLHAGEAHFLYARERARCEDIFTYDVEVRTAYGDLEEQWRGLQLRLVELFPPRESWNEALLGPYMERKLNEFLPEASIQLIIQRDADGQRQASSDLAFRTLLGSSISVRRRPDGKPVLMERLSPTLSASHHAQLTLVIASPRQVGCDIEAIVKRPSTVWQDLLGPERSQLAAFLASQTGEDLDTESTRLWAVSECLKKAGALVNVPLRFGAKNADGWVCLKAGAFLVATYAAELSGGEGRLVLAICAETENSAELEQATRR